MVRDRRAGESEGEEKGGGREIRGSGERGVMRERKERETSQ
jgi:hypothetical protein